MPFHRSIVVARTLWRAVLALCVIGAAPVPAPVAAAPPEAALTRSDGLITPYAVPHREPPVASLRREHAHALNIEAVSKRASLDAARLPPDAPVINRRLRVWDEYRGTILIAAGVLIGQFLLIGGLLVQGHRRRRAERALRDLSGQLIAAHEEERRRIARELHDNVSQRIALLAIRIDQMAAGPAQSPVAVAASIRDLRKRTVEISGEIHTLTRQLHSARLEMLGLVEALRGHCQELVAQGLHASFHEERIPASLPPDVALCLFRIAQEALNNVIKHSGAREAQVTLCATGPFLVLSVTDAGHGFHESVTPRRGLGLATMRERLRLIDGELTVRSRPGQGTTITARVPTARRGA